MNTLNLTSRILIAVSALMLIAGYYTPIWEILMWAPQYPEWLSMTIHIDDIAGDVKIISALNHYIGMKHIEVEMFPEFGYMKYILGGLIGIGLLAAAIGKRWSLWIYITTIIALGVAALVDFWLWVYDYGHNLDPNAAISIPGMTYQPPLIGTKQLLNFTAYSGPDVGGYIILASAVIAIGVLVKSYFKKN